MKNYNLLIVFMLAAVISCEKEPVDIVYSDLGDRKGVFISCEGNFMYGNASLSFYDKENHTVYNNVFFARNRAPLGDVAQSVASDGKHLFVVVNNSGKVVVMDKNTLEFKHVISDLVSPRFIHFVNSAKAYISDLYARRITIINPSDFTKRGFIDVSNGESNSTRHPTETFAQIGKNVFVACWSYDNQILVIDSETDEVTGAVTVPMQPKKMVVDVNQKLWVLCDGSFKGAPGGYEQPALVRIDPVTLTIEQIFRWTERDEFSGDMQMNPAKDSLYFIAGDLYKMAVNSRKMPDAAIVKAGNRLFFSLGVDPEKGDIYLTDAIDYMQHAIIYRYTANGQPVDSFRAGVNPGHFWFN
jgi:hypothetical protein